MTNFGKTISAMVIIIIAVVAIWLMSRKPAVAPVEQMPAQQQVDTVPTGSISNTDDTTLEADLNAVDTSLGEVSADATASAATQ